MRYSIFSTPLTRLLIAGDDEGLRQLSFLNGRRQRAPHPGWRRDDGSFASVHRQLAAYFAGELRTFALELRPAGTGFQLAVWWQLAEIPYGQTISYGELARRLGRPRASRAVGAANGANPIAIVLPCHRVIGAGGGLTGYGGGLELKAALLEHERRHSHAQRQLDLV